MEVDRKPFGDHERGAENYFLAGVAVGLAAGVALDDGFGVGECFAAGVGVGVGATVAFGVAVGAGVVAGVVVATIVFATVASPPLQLNFASSRWPRIIVCTFSQ